MSNSNQVVDGIGLADKLLAHHSDLKAVIQRLKADFHESLGLELGDDVIVGFGILEDKADELLQRLLHIVVRLQDQEYPIEVNEW